MKLGNFCFLVVFLLTSTSFANCGGEGPVPLVDITHGFGAQEYLLSPSGINEFLFWEQRNTLVYRDKSNRLLALDFNIGFPTFITDMNFPLSRVTDGTERYLLGSGENGDGWFTDAEDSKISWIHYYTSSDPITPLYWNDQTLYSATLSQKSDGSEVLNILSYVAEEPQAKNICSYPVPFGENWKLAKGQEYPYVNLYHSYKGPLGQTRLELITFDPEQCDTSQVTTLGTKYDGDIEDVFQFSSVNATAVKVNAPEKNLLWWPYDDECRYYNINNLQPIILSFNTPVIATWDANSGLNLVYLREGKIAQVLQDFDLTSVRPTDGWMSDSQRHLLIAPVLQGNKNRSLIGVDLPRVQ